MRLRIGLAFALGVVAIILVPGLLMDKRENTAETSGVQPPTSADISSQTNAPVSRSSIQNTPDIFRETRALHQPPSTTSAPLIPRWPEPELGAFKKALAFYRAEQLNQGDEIKARINNSTTRDTLEWMSIRINRAGIDRSRIEAFLRRNPDWPSVDAFRRRIESLYLQEAPATDAVLAYFDQQPPLTISGKLAYSRALADSGHSEPAFTIARTLWQEETLTPAARRSLLDTHGENLTAEHHRIRLRNLLYSEEWDAATEVALRAGREDVALAEAFIAVEKSAPDAEKLLEAIPTSLRDSPEWLLAKSRYERRRGNLKAAADVLARAAAKTQQNQKEAISKTAEASEITIITAPIPDDDIIDTGTTGKHWVLEQRLIARALLDAGNAQAAYTVAAMPFAVRESDHIDAAFFAGWIALRFLSQPEKAAEHFAEAAPHATLPISIARVTYWRGRASQALDKMDEAKTFFTEAAGHATTYYGQLAREELGLEALAVRNLPEATPQARFDLSQMKIAQAVQLLFAANEADLALQFLPDLARSLDDDHLAALAEMVQELKDARAALILGKIASYRGKAFDIPAFPTFGIPNIGKTIIEEPMIYAITRQESAFDSKAISHAGARGLMQLMPATAQETARNAGLPFEQSRLTADAAYNAQLGSTHLGELIERWNGSYILAIASYNAGPGNVRKWIATYGDPRSARVDPVDWVERIPFTETRNYVQRVLENLQVYRLRLNNETALLLSEDMQRGRK